VDISAIGRQFGLDEAQTKAALDALVPVVAAGMRKQAQSPTGLQDIFKSVLTGGYAGTLDDENAIAFERAKPRGDDALGQIFGSKDVSREVAQQLSATSGIGAAVLKKLLPIVASIVMGQVAKKMGAGSSSGGGGLGDILGEVLGGGQSRQTAPGGGGLGDILGDILAGGQKQQAPSGGSGGGLGDILKDVLGGGQAAPAPAPRQSPGSSSGNPLEDILADILAGGQNGKVIVKQVPQDQMGDILKDIFGGNFPGSDSGADSSGGAPTPRGAERGRKTLDDMLGGGTRSGNAGDDLLNSVEDAIRRRR
jgi:hypothetical protein